MHYEKFPQVLSIVQCDWNLFSFYLFMVSIMANGWRSELVAGIAESCVSIFVCAWIGSINSRRPEEAFKALSSLAIAHCDFHFAILPLPAAKTCETYARIRRAKGNDLQCALQ